jgi:putative endopeptidase
LAPNFNWANYFTAIGVNTKDINVAQPEFFKSVSTLLNSYPTDVWKMYLKWNLINSTAGYLTSDFENASFDFYGTVLSGSTKMQERWKRVLGSTNGALGEALGQIFVKKHFPPEAKERMINLVTNIKASLNERIVNLDWMSEETKVKAQDKLAAMNLKIGYPDQWIDYSSIDINRDSYIANALNARKFNFRKEMEKINKPVDRGEWHMSPQTVNAYYSPTMNEVVFPAGILQPPFFYLDGDNFAILDSLHVNGKLTLGENIADLGGVTASLQALKKTLNGNDVETINGFTPIQRFFLSYSQLWSQNIRDKEQMRRLKEDVHSPGVARVNGIIAIVPEFYEAFDIKPENKLYIKVEDRAKIW